MSAGVCLPRGFRAGAGTAGLKSAGAPDVALVASDGDATSAAGVFTTNRVSAAPVRLSRAHVADGRARVIVVNSGNANACTGIQGEQDAATMAEAAANATGVVAGEVLVASTGVIGTRLPMARVLPAIWSAAGELSPEGGDAAAEAIRTTDAYAKTAGADVELVEGRVRIGAMAKGAGMIRPDMATTIAVVTTDAIAPPELLAALLRRAADASFNRISVDGSTSTNDCILALAGGASGVELGEAAAPAFLDALTSVLLRLAKLIVRDGEGASRFCRYEVLGAPDDAQAEAAARAVGEDILVRCALEGADPNWGRMLARLGSCGIELDPARVDVWFGDVQLVQAGEAVDGRREAARAALTPDEVEVRISLGAGSGSAAVYASSLSPAYVSFNGEYTT